MDGRWLAGRRPRHDAEFRLFCLAYAGGSASVYHEWRRLVPAHVDVCPVELPGRGGRWGEPAFTELDPLVRAMATALSPALDLPFALFGHSMGGLLAFELARTLRDQGKPQPCELFVSATSAPGGPRTGSSVHRASDAELTAEIRRLGGTPAEVLADADLMALTLPALRADYAVLETYEYRPAAPLEVPITVFGGAADRIVPPSALRGWTGESLAGVTTRMLPGDHFFLRSAAGDLVSSIVRTLARHRTGVRNAPHAVGSATER
ncbi:thioesterase II family protein [Amycolatopsis aidingensis]|uniref:thioesterase II family protein n=1 Tax=Amycolatopsis aidingensis TaxID=2842453 RepID=UPI001C0B54A8|nr:alpha/beta fold hydrolase [Amycolatopsis aidingensis]